MPFAFWLTTKQTCFGAHVKYLHMVEKVEGGVGSGGGAAGGEGIG